MMCSLREGTVYIISLLEIQKIVKDLPAMQKTWVPSLSQEDPLEKGMVTHASILTWENPWTEQPHRVSPAAQR